MMSKKRDYNDPIYRKFRQNVLKRDGKKCKMCRSRRKLVVHHIKKWGSHPGLRYSINNGITLCKSCHQKIKGQEENYELFFLKLLLLKKQLRPLPV